MSREVNPPVQEDVQAGRRPSPSTDPVAARIQRARTSTRRSTGSRARAVRVIWTALTAVLALAPAACVNVPDSGPVRDGISVVPDDAAVDAQYVPEGPTEDAEPTEIVRGYLAAMLAHPTNPGVVREYLTEEAAGAWQPDVGALIFSGTASIRVTGQGVQLDLTQLGTLDERGSWSSTPSEDSAREIELTLVQEDGEWRISNPPQGMLIREDFFENRYQAYSLFFLDPTATTLVPEQVYLPDGEQTATLLVRGLASGPTAWLRGGVDSLVSYPTESALSVPVDGDGVATVPIGVDTMTYRPEERRLLAAQLAWTLDQLPQVRSIRATSEGAPVSLLERQRLLDVDFAESFDPADAGASRTLFALRDGAVVTVPVPDSGGEVTPVPGPLGSGELEIDGFGVDREGKKVAITAGGSLGVASLTEEGGEVDYWFDQGEALLAPQWDRFGLVWAVDRRADASAVYTIIDGTPQTVDVADEPLSPRRIERFAVSRDGLRIAVIDGTGAASRLLVARVVRPEDPEGQVRIDRWRAVTTPSEPLSHFRDLTWASPTELAVLARRANETHEAYTVDIDGSDVQASTLLDFNPQAIAANPTQDTPTVVSGDDGRLYNQTNERWTQYLQVQGSPQLSQPTYVE